MAKYLIETILDSGKGEDIKVVSLDKKTNEEILSVIFPNDKTLELACKFAEIKDWLNSQYK